MEKQEYEYYKFRNGYYFKLDRKTFSFYVLKNNVWEQDDTLVSLYYDPAIDYEQIEDSSVIEYLEGFNNSESDQEKSK